jgi:serine/threonine protein kinase
VGNILIFFFILILFFKRSIAYLPPEILGKRGHSRTVDWYLVGVMLYELIVGIPPYYNSKKEVIFFYY